MSDENRIEDRCPECAAPVSAGKTCRDHFHNVLFLEAEVPGGQAGKVAHFYAVAAYGLQHADSMGYTVETVDGLRAAVRSVLAGEADTEDIRRRVAHASRVNGRVTRRGYEATPDNRSVTWPMVVTDVLAGGADVYAESVERWARSVVDALDATERDSGVR